MNFRRSLPVKCSSSRSSVGSHESSSNIHHRARGRSASLSDCESVLQVCYDPPLTTSPPRVSHYDLASSMRRFRSSMVGDALSVDPFWTDGVQPKPYDNHVETERSRTSFLFKSTKLCSSVFINVASQVPAVILISLFHFMIGIPFGVSYFPIGWNNEDNSADDEGIRGPFPLPGKEALGIRMFLFSTIIAQLSLTAMSGFTSPIGLQMVENVPFCHALSRIVIERQGYGIDSLSTLIVLFGLSSIVVGAVFYALGRFNLGRVVYYFPNHVLVGCIGGIGIFIAKTGVEVAINAVLSWSNLMASLSLMMPLLFFEALLRLLHRALADESGKPLFSLLSPIYFCFITPMFYMILWLFHIDLKHANEIGFFFPSLVCECNGTNNECCMGASAYNVFNKDLFEMWTVVDFNVVSWSAIADAVPTMVALILFSLIHVPINIPAYAVSTDTVADMNKELIAHGYSNIFSGLFGGLQNYFAYTQSVLYHRSGGQGKASGIAVAVCTISLYVIGPLIASYIPRCMAGTLLLHVGIDLFLEGVYDSIGKFDNVEYAGIWLITIVMSAFGMEAAMIAGGIAAVSTHAVQSVHYVSPIRGAMTASTLRSSRWNRTNEQRAILDEDAIGRDRILVVQLQGHLFFGNMAQFTENIHRLLSDHTKNGNIPWIVILDFSLVLGIDSSAAQSITKLSGNLHKSFGVDLCIFVSGSDSGFPCEFSLSKELTSCRRVDSEASHESTSLLRQSNSSKETNAKYTGSSVEKSLDFALAFAEDALLHRRGVSVRSIVPIDIQADDRVLAIKQLSNLCPNGTKMSALEILFSYFQRETYICNDILWTQGSNSDSMKLLVRGHLIALLENEAGTQEFVHSGNTVGELGLLQGLPRMSTLRCHSNDAVLYTLSRDSFEDLCRSSLESARLLDLICIRYLSARVQHVSNRIFETRCLPI